MNKLNLFTPVSSLGYGVVGSNLFKSLSNSMDVALFLIGGLEGTEDEVNAVKSAMGKGDVFDGFDNAPCLKVWHEFSLAERIGNGPFFAFPFFEIDTLDQRRINHLSSVDGIIVASEWAKKIVRNHIGLPQLVSVAPLGVDTSIFTHGPHETTDSCVFLNCGKWDKRKGHDVLLEMFKAAFPDEKDVELWMMSENPFLSESTGYAKVRHEWERYYTSDPRVRLIGRVPTHNEVAQVMSRANCGIFPSRAEGWNLELLEMMSMGKHVIATDYSAHTEFCTHENTALIEINNLEKAEDGLFFDGSVGEWASLEGDAFTQAVEFMRHFYEDWRSDRDQQYNTEGVETAKQLTWTNTANKIEEIIYGNKGTATE